MNSELIAYAKHCWKSIAAFGALLATNVATRWVTNNEPLPETGKDWAAFAITTVGGTWLVWVKANGDRPAKPAADG
ncbi:hypothetical protein [Mycolicibacterium sp.]|uniref:hypothetical protein n=1 Tax=Mycolicibacterium sp. TaxID=2320850 RepID=UPI00355CE191